MEKITYDSDDQIKQKIDILRKTVRSKKMIDISFRKQQLKILLKAVKDSYNQHLSSKKIDLGWSDFMTFYASYTGVVHEIEYIISNFESWTQKRYVDTPIAFCPASSYILPEPYGVTLILSAWNSQFLTLIMPLAAAISAGNVVLAKPSEMSEATALISQEILSKLDSDIVQVVQGDYRACEFLLKNQFDFIVFTGSPEKGKSVAKAAAEYLTPCILELGGQNPTIVDETCHLENAVINICNGRFLNSGQICISPEYVFVHETLLDKFTDGLKRTLEKFYSGKAKESADYGKMINRFHTERVGKKFEQHGGKLIIGGKYSIDDKYIEPTIISYDSIEQLSKSSLAKEEIFGPILYYCPYKNLDDVINHINRNPKPLSMYYFGTSSENKKRLETETSSGAITMNDTIIHFTSPYLPFGGVGNSGTGSYHGKWGFDNMSHLKPVLDRKPMVMGLRYPPFTATNQKIMKFMLANLNFTQRAALKFVLFSLIIVVALYYRNCILCCLNSVTKFNHH